MKSGNKYINNGRLTDHAHTYTKRDQNIHIIHRKINQLKQALRKYFTRIKTVGFALSQFYGTGQKPR